MNTSDTLRCQGLIKRFGGVHALNDFSLDLPVTGLIAIVGPNGAGKTTLLHVLTGFVRPDSGRCILGQRNISHLTPHRIARLGIARTFQDLRLVQLVPVLENVLLARPNQRGENPFWALTGIGVSEEERRNREAAVRILRFVGLEERAEEPAGELSYGQQKLLTFACCLATEARILLLDEPVAGVHPEMAERILGLLQSLRSKGKLIVFVEHDMAAVRRVAERVIVMDAGRAIADGEPSDVLSRSEILEAYTG